MPLYAFGSNGSYQLSLAHAEDVSVPSQCHFSSPLPPDPPQAIVAGGNHTLLLFPTGQVFAAGNNSVGQCGLGKEVDFVKTFTAFPSIPRNSEMGEDGDIEIWRYCAAGWEFTILGTRDGKRIYSFGHGPRGELGLGPEVLSTSQSATPQLIPDFPPPDTHLVHLTSSITHVVAVLSNGTVYGWGASRKGQLGSPRKAIFSPTLINIPFSVVQAACTIDSTLVISTSGERHELLGPTATAIAAKTDQWGLRTNLPSQGELSGATSIYSSWSGYYVHFNDGRVRCWGRGDKGQLLAQESELQGRVQQMAVGSEHVVATVADEEVSLSLVAWGWSEHGNCGTVADSVSGHSNGQTVKIPIPHPEGQQEKKGIIRCIGAGCATSWVWIDWG